ncbi:MAG: carbamoyl-phosphate synthase large subunit [Acidobacteria bacterium]|nr:carbamoyl-phosphate synthase large subunit [Acidobacteriota bacterium]
MPKRTDIKKILIIGSGPIVIGQACEFDYSGTQACKALKSEGYPVVLVNSNPATIMTDPELADRTYIEPLTADYLEAIIAAERPDVLLPTVGGQTALNLAVELAESGVLEKYGVELIGASLRAIKIAEDRLWFKDAAAKCGLETPRSQLVNNLKDARSFAEKVGYPVVVRPSFTLGGTGGGIAFNPEELDEIVSRGLDLSPVHEVLIEESVLGWKEFELEVMRDLADNVVVICSIENFDPMGVHTGDSITVAPAQTLTDKEYQQMRDGAKRIIREVGVDTGGSNIQFAVHPENGRLLIIEMNPRVSRSSALASKATGFPIAKIAAKLAVGFRLDEIPNDITQKTLSSFEPTIDYVVVKIPKWQFEKFPGADRTLGTEMRSVGEVMAIGRSFAEALLKGMRSLETGKRFSFPRLSEERLRTLLVTPTPERLEALFAALRQGMGREEICRLTAIDPWFVRQLEEIVALEQTLAPQDWRTVPGELLRAAKRAGFSDQHLAELWQTTEEAVRARRLEQGVEAVFKRVDTCAAEFESFTPYLYSTYEDEDETEPTATRKIMILGSGPNRIGQGIEFDYCCCHAAFALKDAGYETLMVNCNPETVSTDYDTSDRLYFEPLTFENVMNIVARERPTAVIVQFGGQTPLNLARALEQAGVNIIGTSPDSIDWAEDRQRFSQLLRELSIPQPRHGTARSVEEAVEGAERIGYPVVVRPSYVLGGRAMVIAYDRPTVETYAQEAGEFEQAFPILIDQFLEDSFELDVDALADGEDVYIGGIMEHIEEAGIHSGDSSCVLPAYQLEARHLDTIRDYTARLARALKVVGLMNVQYAVPSRPEGGQGDTVYVLEVNPRASRTVPYVSKATGVPLAKIAALLMTGGRLRDFGLAGTASQPAFYAVKSPVFPFGRFPGVDTILGPEMKSTGEVMAVGSSFGLAFAKAQLSAGQRLPTTGHAFLSVNNRDKQALLPIARQLVEHGFQLVATRGTAEFLRQAGLGVAPVFKVNEGRPHVVDLLKTGKIQLVINTPLGRKSFYDERAIRRAAVRHQVPCITTLEGAMAAVTGIEALQKQKVEIHCLQDLHTRLAAPVARPVPPAPESRSVPQDAPLRLAPGGEPSE